jgi:hypothetical protein
MPNQEIVHPDPVAYYRGFHIIKLAEGDYRATPSLKWQSDRWEGPFPSITAARTHIDLWLTGQI